MEVEKASTLGRPGSRFLLDTQSLDRSSLLSSLLMRASPAL